MPLFIFFQDRLRSSILEIRRAMCESGRFVLGWCLEAVASIFRRETCSVAQLDLVRVRARGCYGEAFLNLVLSLISILDSLGTY